MTVLKGSRKFTFHCLRALSPCKATQPSKCELMIDADGSHGYDITVDAGDQPGDGTSSPILITLIGEKKSGQKKIFVEKGIKPSSSHTFTYYTTEIGTLIGFEMALENNGDFSPKRVYIKDLSKINF